jgi:orotate phosphoribosyltransferase
MEKVTTDPVILSVMAKELAKSVDTNIIAGIELESVYIAVAVALETKKKFVIVRKEPKSYGTNSRIDGNFEYGDRIIIIDNVTKTGNSALKAANILRESGAIVDTILTVIDTEEGGAQNLESENLKLMSLLNASDIVTDSN